MKVPCSFCFLFHRNRCGIVSAENITAACSDTGSYCKGVFCAGFQVPEGQILNGRISFIKLIAAVSDLVINAITVSAVYCIPAEAQTSF